MNTCFNFRIFFVRAPAPLQSVWDRDTGFLFFDFFLRSMQLFSIFSLAFDSFYAAGSAQKLPYRTVPMESFTLPPSRRNLSGTFPPRFFPFRQVSSPFGS